jgi:signal transduction histidine kinase
MLADLDEMEKMVSASLSFARDDTAGEPRSMVDLRSLVERVCDEAVDAGHDVTADTGENPVRSVCQPSALRRALTNLIDNAVNYGGRAAVSLREDDDAVRITIEDEGPGIPDELQEDAFRPFRRLETSRCRETGGTGLGLSVARTIIRAHGGDIRLANRAEGGLRAEVRLPSR